MLADRRRRFAPLALVLAIALSIASTACSNDADDGAPSDGSSAALGHDAASTTAAAPTGGVKVTDGATGWSWRMEHAPSRRASTTQLADDTTAPFQTWTDTQVAPSLRVVGVIDVNGRPYDLRDGISAIATAMSCTSASATEVDVAGQSALRAAVDGCQNGLAGTLHVIDAPRPIVVIAVDAAGSPATWSGDDLVATMAAGS